MILNYKAQQKAQLFILSKLTKSLKDEELRFQIKNTASSNFAKKEKSKLTSYGNHANNGKKLTKDLDQKNKSCKTYGNSQSQ